MKIEFTKMNGAGNDFILIDNRDGRVQLTPQQVARLCHRQAGIGADGLMLLIPNKSGKADWSWDFYNNDGSTAEMCGNGARCFARFIQKAAGAGEKVTFETAAGIITGRFEGDRVTVNLTAPKDYRPHQKVAMKSGETEIHSLNTGVPHAVIYVADADKAMVTEAGPEVRFHQHFAPRGTNVNFVQVLAPNHIRVRTYERGVEGETLACGTGVTACALVSSRLRGFTSPVKVQVQGGDTLEVRFAQQNGEFTEVALNGPADFSFTGVVEV